MARLQHFLFVLLLSALVPAVCFSQNLTQLTSHAAADRNPSWTPDAQFIVFESNRTGNWQLYRMNADGSNVVQLTFGSLGSQQPDVSPNGQTIVFSIGDYDPSTSGASIAYIASLPIGGGTPTVLTPQTSNHIDSFPTWSANGTKVYFHRREPIGTQLNYSLYEVPGSGGPATLFLNVVEVEHVPVVSPDGLHLAYSGRDFGQPLNVYEVPISNPTQITQITFDPVTCGPEDYSPDGIHLMYGSRRLGGKSELFEFNRTNGQSTRVTFDTDTNPGDPVYGAGEYHPTDPGRFAYSSARVDGNQNIWLLDRDLPPGPGSTLSVAGARGLPGGEDVPVAILLSNDQPVAGLQFDLSDLPELVTQRSIRGVGRGAGLTVDFVDDGKSHVLAFAGSGIPIPAGSGPILELLMEPAAGATPGEVADLSPVMVLLVTPGGDEISVAVESGTFTIGARPGDINGDNQVDGGDLVRLVEIILSKGSPPTPDELERADCNEDELRDVRDVICLLGLIEPAASVPSTIADSDAPLVLDIRRPIRSVSLKLPAGSAGPRVTAELSPLQMRVGTENDGTVSVLLWDPSGGELPVGVRTVLRTDGAPLQVRAWGEGGNVLALRQEGTSWIIGAPNPEIGPRIVRSVPNPFLESTVMHFQLPEPAVVRIEIFNASGALVRRLLESGMPAGDQAVTWDGRDDLGRRVAAGIYQGRVASAEIVELVRMVRLNR